MNKKEIITRELEELDILSASFTDKVSKELSKIRSEAINLYLTKPDKYRLLVLRSWMVKYQVNLNYILVRVLPFWEMFIRRRSKKMQSIGLNVKVSTLTGKKSEQILQEMIQRDFPGGANKAIYISEQQDKIFNRYVKSITKFETDSIPVKTSPSIRRYVRNYKKQMQHENKLREEIKSKYLKRPHRTNPFKGTD